MTTPVRRCHAVTAGDHAGAVEPLLRLRQTAMQVRKPIWLITV
ncbi:MAG: hypothetical protein ACRDT8_02840 [Micromonosporaceae bacterium]